MHDGITGDGWNHLDGLQTNVTAADSIPEPSTIGLLILGICGLFKNRLRK
ncbi:MAG: PEP-CTERM sorting domain-containing protein [Candidatus Auribacterota bacterium]